ncbi:MAG TPA: aminotransferase class V-fold PLP-dependent enzyme [Aeromicrobium sp.]|nr:aminotransferase class V-fold PLP-dependent enzyme [Aeromicrobium sp.]
MSPDQILAELAAKRTSDLPTHGGQTLAYVYDSGLGEADEVAKQAIAMYAATNGLDPTAFPSLLSMESELISFARSILHADDQVIGTVTSGGTESILLAVQTARDAAKVNRPAIVTPSTIHAAFAKAAHYFGVELVTVPVGVNHRADVAAMTRVIDELGERVVLIAASAPSYAHGVIDPITELAAVARVRGLRFHVDGCIGGWVLPWMEEVPAWDFAVPGVTSLSVDLHKYAYTPKGVSLLLHANPQLRRPQFFAHANWPGYTMLNSTTQSTKSGGPLAAAWAVVNLIGSDGYRELVSQTVDATAAVARGIEAIDHLHLVEQPETSLVVLGADDTLDVFTLSDLMLDRGWFVQPQMQFAGEPANLHLTLCAATAESVPQFLSALAESVTEAVARGPIQIDPLLAQAAASLDPETLDDEAFDGLLAIAGLAGEGGKVQAPERLGQVNALLDVASPEVREALLIAFLDRLTR